MASSAIEFLTGPLIDKGPPKTDPDSEPRAGILGVEEIGADYMFCITVLLK